MVERGVARFGDESLAGTWHELAYQIATGTGESSADELMNVTIPVALVVVRVDDGNPAASSRFNDRGQTLVSFSQRAQQLLTMLVSEVIQEVYEKKDVTHRGGLSLPDRPHAAEAHRRGDRGGVQIGARKPPPKHPSARSQTWSAFSRSSRRAARSRVHR